MRNEIITFTSPKSSVSEIFRTLRTNVQFMTASRNKKSILFTSTQEGDGKSWIAANLAVTFAQAGKKVILVDTDLRRGRQHNIFELSNSKGLSNYLILTSNKPEESIGEYIQTTLIDNLYVITAGVVPPNPSELLVSTKMIDLIKILEEMADIVILDSTPSTMITDAIAICRYVGSTIIVATHKRTKLETLKQIKKNIENVGGKVSGVILNKVPLNKKQYGKSYYYEGSTLVPITKGRNKINMSRFFFNNDEEIKSIPIEEIEPKADKIDEENNYAEKNEKENKNEDDLNVLLKQLTRYLENRD